MATKQVRWEHHHHQYPYLTPFTLHLPHISNCVVSLQLVTCTENIEKYNVEIYRYILTIIMS